MNARPLLISLALMLTGLTAPVTANDRSEDFGDYEVHYNVFPSTFLTPEVAASNNLNRSRSIGVVNIAIMEKTDDGGLRTVPGQVEGKVLNDIRQARFLAFRRIQEGDAVYFISEYQYRPSELMTFQITARPNGHDKDLRVRFSQELFND